MTIGVSIFLIAVGAILKFATHAHVAHISLETVGVILMICGLAGLILGFVQERMWARRTERPLPAEDRPVERPPRY